MRLIDVKMNLVFWDQSNLALGTRGCVTVLFIVKWTWESSPSSVQFQCQLLPIQNALNFTVAHGT